MALARGHDIEYLFQESDHFQAETIQKKTTKQISSKLTEMESIWLK